MSAEGSKLARCLEGALRRRAPLLRSKENTCCRLLNGAADGCPDVAVDRFEDVLILSLYRPHSDEEERALSQVLADRLSPRSIYVKRRPREARVLSNTQKEELAPSAPLWGEPVDSLVAKEGGLSFLIRPAAGLSVGLFLDMREVRAFVRRMAKGRTVFNGFAYTCAFSVAALAGGATRVVNVDASRRVLSWGQENARLNGQQPDRRDYLAGDVFDWLSRLSKKEERFGLVIVDPPSFSTTGTTRFSAARDYPSLVEAASRVVCQEGLLLACCNLAGLTTSRFSQMVLRGASAAGRKAKVQQTLGASTVDFPWAPSSPHGLTVLAVQLDRSS